MNKWKRLSLALIVGLTFNAIQADSCCPADDCNTCCDKNDCCDDTGADCRGGRVQSKSVIVDFALGASGTYLHEVLFRNDRMAAAEDGCGGAMQLVAVGGASSNKSQGELGRRFGICGKRCLVVAEGSDTSVNGLARDIDARHFNIETTTSAGTLFNSTICFCPKQKLGGGILSYMQSLCRNEDDSIRWWAEVILPVIHVDNEMNLVETVLADGGGALADTPGLDGADRVGNMTAAFKQTAMKYGRIDCSCDLDKTQLANAEFKIGYNSVVGRCCHLESYIGFAAETTADRCATFLFEPVHGQEHWAILWGSTLGFEIYECDESTYYAKMALDARYWFENEELRSFDVKGKSWGRYMEMYKDLEAAQAAAAATDVRTGTFGINLMTRCVDVTPGYQLNYNAALVYEGCNFLAEFGHTLYARQAEEICPNWADGPVLKAFAGDGDITDVRNNQKP